MKDNKLIAEFMGRTDLLECNFEVDDRNKYYHNSWDWLMPVIEKIMDISFQEEGEYEDFYSIRDIIPDIGQTYKAVVEFIKGEINGTI